MIRIWDNLIILFYHPFLFWAFPSFSYIYFFFYHQELFNYPQNFESKQELYKKVCAATESEASEQHPYLVSGRDGHGNINLQDIFENYENTNMYTKVGRRQILGVYI